jgi:hypothetical protein
MSVLADAVLAEVVRCAFDLTTPEFQQIILAEPAPDEAAGVEGTTVRLVGGRPCLVFEDPDGNYGGSYIQSELIDSAVPFVQHNGSGHEYGPASTAFLPGETEIIRLDRDLNPIAGIRLDGERALVDRDELADLERYGRLRRRILLYPAVTT